jgi:hypothetical protein
MPETLTNGVSAAAVKTTGGGRLLPGGASGFLLVGKLRFAAVSTRHAKQFQVDVESCDADGRVTIFSPSGFMADQDGAATKLGRLAMSGAIGSLVGEDVVVSVSYRVGRNKDGVVVDRVYWTIEDIAPLGVEGNPPHKP